MADRPLISADTCVLIAPGDTSLGRVLVALAKESNSRIIAAMERDLPDSQDEEETDSENQLLKK